MLDELRERITIYLNDHQVCVITTNGSQGAWAVAAQYKPRSLDLDCRVPRWSDALYHLEQDPRVLVLIHDPEANPMRWLQYRGLAQVDRSSANERYVVTRITPDRIDLLDESRGWGARETLDL